MKQATFNYQVDEAENEDSDEDIDGILEGETPMQEQPYGTNRGQEQEFGTTGDFIPVKSKNGRVFQKYDIHDPDTNSLENIAHLDDQDPYDEQKSGGESESDDQRSVRSQRTVKSNRSQT